MQMRHKKGVMRLKLGASSAAGSHQPMMRSVATPTQRKNATHNVFLLTIHLLNTSKDLAAQPAHGLALNAAPLGLSPVVDTNPAGQPGSNSEKPRVVSVMIPAELLQDLERRAEAMDESVTAFASRLVSEALKSMPLD